jgi:ElaA protein
MKINWQVKKFEALTNTELYDILKLRMQVFVVEQNCPYLDTDGKDLKSYHLSGRNELGDLVAYSRLLPENVSYKEVSIGRVVTSPKARRTGAGKELMSKSIETIRELFGEVSIRIGAQLYLQKFYEGHGFIKVSDEYLEDNILHIEMIRK